METSTIPSDSTPNGSSLSNKTPTKTIELPAELERQIFEVTAREFPGTAAKLAGLAKKTQYWMDWYIYETVALDNPVSRTQAFLRTVSARPSEFFAQRVKRLYLSYTVLLPEAQSILKVCTGLTELTCWAQSFAENNGWLIAPLKPSLSTLTRLSVRLDMITNPDEYTDFSDEIFQDLTHLEIVTPPAVSLGLHIDWTKLFSLPKLKYFIIGDLYSWQHLYLLPLIRGLLCSSKALEVLVVLAKKPDLLDALEAENFDDQRLVIIPNFNWPRDLPTYWKEVYSSGLDCWDVTAEKVKKQRLEWEEKRAQDTDRQNDSKEDEKETT